MVLEFNVFMCDESLIQPTRVMKLWFLLTIEMYAESTALEQFNMTLITFLHIQDMTSIIFLCNTKHFKKRKRIYIYI